MVRGVNGLSAYSQMAQAQANQAAARSDPADAAGFGDSLSQAVGAVETQQHHADGALSLLASGEVVDLHGTMIELEKADIALRTLVSVRDKFIAAYEQVMNMSV